MIANSLDIQNITNDKGVSFDEEMNPIKYNYEEESSEPIPTRIDNLAPVTHISDKEKLANLMSVTHFNDLYMRNVGNTKNDPRNILSESLYGSSLKGDSRKMTAMPPLTSQMIHESRRGSQRDLTLSPTLTERKSSVISRHSSRSRIKTDMGRASSMKGKEKKIKQKKWTAFNPEPQQLTQYLIT